MSRGFIQRSHELVAECGGSVSELDAAALTYIAFAIDKVLNYNSRMSVWMSTREVVANTFNRHDFAFCWSHAEMAPTIVGLGYDWTVEQTGKSLRELIALCSHQPSQDNAQLTLNPKSKLHTPSASITLTRGSGDNLPAIHDASIDAVVLDPPYYDNVMYAELADFFYVWLKRTAGLLFPEQFADHLTDKDREAVANPAKFKDFSKVKGSGGAKKRASRDYQERMQAIFAEARRVLKPDGIMTLMFTHKATGAWDALAKGLVDAGFVITASWPI
jgi:putative DNA methylase